MYQQIEDITLLRLLGKGSYGEVYLSLKQNAKKLFATKKVKRKKTDDEMTKYFKNEINILRILNHPNIVKLEEIKMDENNYYIVMEYINGGELSLYSYGIYQWRRIIRLPKKIYREIWKTIF